MQALGIKRRLGCVYPQQQGMVERANGILKSKINKKCEGTGMNYTSFAYCPYATNHFTHLTLHEMLMRQGPVGAS